MTKILAAFVACFALCFPSIAQNITKGSFGEGLSVVAEDSSFSLNFSARIQSLYEGTIDLETDAHKDGVQIRRARLKFDGFAYTPKLEYKIELAVSNADISGGAIPESGNTANIVLDAFVKWNFAGDWSVWFGQAKLPGNRERVISSQELQFVDRSNLNAMFNLDRDAGIQVHYNRTKVNLAGALSMGEGRNMIGSNTGGYGYTLRAEYLPFGQFTDGGDYFGADLAREPEPRLSMGVTHDINDGASRQNGQLGELLPAHRNLTTWFVDAHFKYKGLSSLLEYAHRETNGTPVITDQGGDFLGAFYTGTGFNWQAGYLLRNNLEVAARYTVVTPEAVTQRARNRQYTLGLSRYFIGHNLKVQGDVSLVTEDNADALVYRLQVELAF